MHSTQTLQERIDTEVPKVTEQIKNESLGQQGGDQQVLSDLDKLKLSVEDSLKTEARVRGETEQAVCEMLKTMLKKINNDLEEEKRERNQNEDILL